MRLNPGLQSFVFINSRLASRETVTSTDLNHQQFNPVTHPCRHEGMRHELDRTWTIRTTAPSADTPDHGHGDQRA